MRKEPCNSSSPAEYKRNFNAFFYFHVSVILRQRAMVCQFASPLDVDQHNKPEVMGGFLKATLQEGTS